MNQPYNLLTENSNLQRTTLPDGTLAFRDTTQTDNR
jgi:hypothetical protein